MPHHSQGSSNGKSVSRDAKRLTALLLIRKPTRRTVRSFVQLFQFILRYTTLGLGQVTGAVVGAAAVVEGPFREDVTS